LGFTLDCTVAVVIDIPSIQNSVAADLPHGTVKRFLIGIIAHVARALEREAEVLAGTYARKVVSCAP
jgi:hypothetical protein